MKLWADWFWGSVSYFIPKILNGAIVAMLLAAKSPKKHAHTTLRVCTTS